MPASPADPTLTRNLRASVGDGTAYGVMVGIGETYLAAFVLAVGLGDVFAGLIASVPILLGSLLQLVSPWGVKALGSHRSWVVLCAGIQASCFIPLIIAALMGTLSPVVALVVASVYWGTSLGTGPAWNTWQGTIIPKAIRAPFFARRSRLVQLATLMGFLIAGFSLQEGKRQGNPVPVFAMLFLGAAACRVVSTLCLAHQTEPTPLPPNMRWLTLSEQWNRFTHGRTGQLLTYIVSLQFAVYVSGPYFSPYMLKALKFSYVEFAMALGICFVAKFMFLPLWGRFAHRYGARSLLWVGGTTIIPLSVAWCVSESYWWVLTIQVLSGIFWAAYELAMVLLFFEAIPEDERTSILTLYNVINSAALCLGSLVGALIFYNLGVSVASYMVVFAASSSIRVLTLPLLWRIPQSHGETADVNLRPLAVRPNDGSIDGPLLSELDRPGTELEAESWSVAGDEPAALSDGTSRGSSAPSAVGSGGSAGPLTVPAGSQARSA